MKCDKCLGKGHLTEDGRAYNDWISPHYKATVVGCIKDLEKGKVTYNFHISEIDVMMHIEIPIEYYYMTTDEREWNHNIDENGERI
jgi:hypothetical protein